MKTISQMAQWAGISICALQYYDEIGLLKPTERTQSGYRLYDDVALERLQEIRFYKELGFKLKDIDKMLRQSNGDRRAAFQKQKELLMLKRERLNRLIQLLERLEKGESCVSFQAFDLSAYIEALEAFKAEQAESVIEHWGSAAHFERFIQRVRHDQARVAQLAIERFGSIGEYTEAMKCNLGHFSEEVKHWHAQVPEEMKEANAQLRLAFHQGEDVASEKVHKLVKAVITAAMKNTPGVPGGNDEAYCRRMSGIYSNAYLKKRFDTQYGAGSSDYMAKAFACYAEENGVSGRSTGD